MKTRGIALLFLLLILAAVLSGCGKLLPPGPEKVAADWYEALGAFDTARMYQLTHPEQRETLQRTLDNPITSLLNLTGLAGATYFDMQYEVVAKDGDMAMVHVTGKASTKLGSITDVDETIELRRYDGHWYVWDIGSGW